MLKISTPKETAYKVLAGFGGGYLYGSSWKLNSGCVKVTEDDKQYMFEGYSGSVYYCGKDSYGFTGLTASIFDLIMKKPESGVTVELLPEDTDFYAICLH